MSSSPRILLWNIRSFRSHRNELILLTASTQAEVVLLTETFLTPNIIISLPGYTVVRSDRATPRGGVAILIKNSIHFKVINKPPDLDLECCLIKTETPSLHIGVVYIPPKYDLNPSSLNKLTGIGSPFIIGGDFNAKHRFWNSYQANKNGKILYNHYASSNYNIMYPNSFTRFQARTRPSTIDFFLTTTKHGLDCEVIEDGGSDHYPVLLKADLNSTSPRSIGIDTLVDWTAYTKFTNNFRIQTKLKSTNDVDSCIKTFTSFLHACLRRATSKIDTSQARHGFLLNDNYLSSLIRAQRRIRKTHQNHGIPLTSDKLRDISTEIRRQISYLRQKDWLHRLSSIKKADPTFWSTYRILTYDRQKTVMPPLSDNNTTACTDADKAELLAVQFVSNLLI